MPCLGGWQVQRRWQVVADCIQERLHALVLEGRAAQHWHKALVDPRVTDSDGWHRVSWEKETS